jgi:hypothetical protein
MTDTEDSTSRDHKLIVEAADVEGIAAALGMEFVDEPPETDEPPYPPQLEPVLETLADIFWGVEEATETDSRGRSRKMVREYAGREDLSSDQVGHVLRVLEGHDLVVQDGNRWRIPEPGD